MDAPLPAHEQIELLLVQVEGRVKDQRDEWDGLDRKATTILATTGVLFGLVVGNADKLNQAPQPGLALFFGSLLSLVLALGVGVVGLWPREFKEAPDPTALVTEYAATPTDKTLGDLAATKAECYRLNTSSLRLKLNLLRLQAVLVTSGAALLVVVLFVSESK